MGQTSDRSIGQDPSRPRRVARLDRALGERVVRTYTDAEDFVRAMRAAGAMP
jgi:hypothetical protein